MKGMVDWMTEWTEKMQTGPEGWAPQALEGGIKVDTIAKVWGDADVGFPGASRPAPIYPVSPSRSPRTRPGALQSWSDPEHVTLLLKPRPLPRSPRCLTKQGGSVCGLERRRD